MATLTSDQAAANIPPYGHGLAGTVKAAFGRYSLTANPSVNDIIEFCRLPKNCIVVGGMLYADNIDTNATETLDIDIGWPANGGGSETLVTRTGTTWTNSGASADSDGFINTGVIEGDAITGLVAAGTSMRAFPMAGGPLFFSQETMVQGLVNAVAATFAAGTITVVVYYIMV